MPRSISSTGLAIVQAFEGCLKPVGKGWFKPYICPAGVLTIGWGHTNHHGRKFDPSSVWSQKECDEALAEDMRGFEDGVTKAVRVPLKQHQYDALVSFAYNCGLGNLGKSTLLRKVNAGDMAGAAAEFAKWNKGGGRVLAGLVRRRKSESLLFQGRIKDALMTAGAKAPSETEMPQQVDPPPERSRSPAPKPLPPLPPPPDIEPTPPPQPSLWQTILNLLRRLLGR